MSHTVFIQTPYTRKHKAEPYDAGNMWVDWKNDYWYKKADGQFNAASSLHSEAVDFARWMMAVMNKELFTPHSSVPSGGDRDVSHTLGFMKPHIPDTDLYFHGGDNTGFTSFYVLDPEKDWGHVVFTNSEYGEDLGNDLTDFLMVDPNR